MITLSKKKDQTFDEAYAAMADPSSPYKLQDVSKNHWKEEVVCAALRNGRATLQEIPYADRTEAICWAAIMCQNNEKDNITAIPTSIFDFSMAVMAASYHPGEIDTILYRFRDGRIDRRYTKEDVQVIMEAACPTGMWNQLRPNEQLSFTECTTQYGKLPTSATPVINLALRMLLQHWDRPVVLRPEWEQLIKRDNR